MFFVSVISVLTLICFSGYSSILYGQSRNLKLQIELDSIRTMDQRYRLIADSIGLKYRMDSKEYNEVLQLMADADSSNSRRIREIISQFGWPGISLVGEQGNITMFLVVQHSNLSMQQYYLPLLRSSVAAGESRGKDLAYLEDRVAIRSGHKQVYGTQLALDRSTGKYFVNLLEDPDHVDDRRKKIGLGPIADYLKSGWNIDWDVEQFKQEQKERELKTLQKN